MAKINTSGGGKKTNKNGLKFEQDTSLILSLEAEEYKVLDNLVYDDEKLVGVLCGKHDLYKFLKEKGLKNYKEIISKKLLPDEAFFNYDSKILYIIEKKFQSIGGSADEKLETCDFKRKQYLKLIKNSNEEIEDVEYIYVLNDWFKKDKYKDTLEYIEDTGCSYYFNELPLKKIGLKNN